MDIKKFVLGYAMNVHNYVLQRDDVKEFVQHIKNQICQRIGLEISKKKFYSLTEKKFRVSGNEMTTYFIEVVAMSKEDFANFLYLAQLDIIERAKKGNFQPMTINQILQIISEKYSDDINKQEGEQNGKS